MGLFNTIINTAINTAKELYEADSNDKLGEYAKEKVSNLVKKVDGTEAREKNQLVDSMKQALQRDDFDNDSFQRKADRYIRNYASDESDIMLGNFYKYQGWRRVLDSLLETIDETDNRDEISGLKRAADDANSNCFKYVRETIDHLDEDSVGDMICYLLSAQSECLHYNEQHLEAARLAIQALPYACDQNEKEYAKRLISGKNYDTEHLIVSRIGGYGVVIDKTLDASIRFLDEVFAFQYDKDSSYEDNDEFLELYADELLDNIQFVKDNLIFSLQPYHDRQFIFTVRDLDHIGGCYDETDNIKYVFPLDELPKDISFPMGHPQANTLYYAHPLRPVYLPFENAQLTLFYEKVQEMCRLFQCLGATKITARCLKGNKISSNVMASSAVSAEGGYKIISGSGGVKNQTNASADSETRDEMFMTQTFSPYKAPYCPKDLVWT